MSTITNCSIIERGSWEVVFEATHEEIVEDRGHIETKIGERFDWLKEAGIPFRARQDNDASKRVHRVVFIFDEYRPLSGSVNLKAQEQATLFKLFWS